MSVSLRPNPVRYMDALATPAMLLCRMSDMRYSRATLSGGGVASCDSDSVSTSIIWRQAAKHANAHVKVCVCGGVRRIVCVSVFLFVCVSVFLFICLHACAIREYAASRANSAQLQQQQAVGHAHLLCCVGMGDGKVHEVCNLPRVSPQYRDFVFKAITITVPGERMALEEQRARGGGEMEAVDQRAYSAHR